ncbi:MFS transporter [Viridibacterium curvum]|uniref:Major facilitator superfamily domain-containing protein 6 n=1 Tax=Viridibacterium curvum TaxID=1101404 RepID=A0ABP9QG60_9RHOO
MIDGQSARLSTYYFCYFAYVGIFMPYFGLFLQSRGFAATEIGILMSMMQIMRLLAPNLWGWIADRWQNRVAVVRLSAVMSLLGFVAIFWAEGFWAYFAALGVMSFFWTATMPLLESMTLDHLAERADRYGQIRAWGSVGFIFASFGMGFVLERWSLGSILPVSTAILASIVLGSLALREQKSARARHHEDHSGLGDILRQPGVLALLLACLLMSAAHGALYVFYSIHLNQAGYAKPLIGALWTLGVLVEIGVFFLMPGLLKRYSLRAILLVCFATAVLRFTGIGWGVASLPLIVLLQCLHGITFGAYHAASVAAVHRWFGPQHQSFGQALYGSMSFGAGGIIGASLSGWLWDHAGPGWTFTSSAGFALAGFLILALAWRGSSR